MLRQDGRTDGQGASGTFGGGGGAEQLEHVRPAEVVLVPTVDWLLAGRTVELVAPGVVLPVPPVTGEEPGAELVVLVPGVLVAGVHVLPVQT